jgi:low temperature requirement protein LtrA
VAGALEAALLLAMIWQLWAYTTWMTNWLDPDKIPVRTALLALMLVSLAMSAALPLAFEDSGLLIGGGYAVMQVGRSIFAVWALRGQPQERNYQRILAWCCLSGALALAGGLAGTVWLRALLWLLAVGTDLLGGAVGFWTPWFSRSTTRDWDIEGGHFAERCQAFVLIALGESIVVIGATLAGLLGPANPHRHGAATVTAFVVAFIGSAALWWLYFDRSADDGARLIAQSEDPGGLARSAYHFIHPVMVAGIIVAAAADEVVLTGPDAAGVAATSWLVLGGAGLYIAGHLTFKLVVWRKLSRQRAAALVVLALLALAAPHVSALALSCCVAAVVVTVGGADYLQFRAAADSGSGPADP